MKFKYLSIIAVAAFSLFSTTSCLDDFDAPNTDDYIVTSPTDIGEVNSTIYDVKQKYCANKDSADYVYKPLTDWYRKVNKDMIIEGVVCANDISGNLYQTLLIRNIDDKKGATDPAHDQCIILAVKSTALYPYFALGQRIKINLKGLYAGVNGKTPRIGTPYKTSSGNIKLGPMFFEDLKNNVQLIGKPDLNAPELTPVDKTDEEGKAWLRASANKNFENCPMLATVRGDIKEASEENRDKLDKGSLDTFKDVYGKTETLSANGKKIFGPYELHDAGYGVERNLALGNGSTVAIRTSTKNRVSFIELPENTRSYTGILSYYTNWQLQMRDTTDISAN
mgnify:CR=1 FL=1